MRRVFVFAALVSLSACFSYQPVAPSATPVVGQDIQVSLTAQGTAELARYLGPGVNRADGRLVEIGDAGALRIAVDYVGMTNGTRQPWSGEGSVLFPREYLDVVRERKFEKRRTIFGSTALAGALVGLAIVAIKGGGAGGGDGGGGTPPAQ
jgi:hypothetical protein